MLISLFVFFSFFVSYHHTISATLLYGLREAISVVCSEGLEKVIARHRQAAEELRTGLNELGLQLYVKNPANRLPTITSIKLPREIDWKKIVEIGANEYVLINVSVTIVLFFFLSKVVSVFIYLYLH